MVQCEDLKDDDQPSNILELFSELDEVLEMIEKLKSNHSQSFEKDYEKFSEVLSRYQEQPHLLDPHLELLLNKLLGLITDPNSSKDLVDGCFKYLYTISKVRTYKCLVKFLPHELADLEFVLDMLEKQDANDSQHWETRYILLLWLSILVLNPFHMARLDVYQTQSSFGENDSDMPIKTKMERIYDLCRLYSENNDTCANVASYLSAKYLVRTDIKEIYLEKFLKWVMEQHDALTVSAKFGQLAAIAAILKHGKREDLLPYADMILRWILSCNYKESSDFLKYRYYMKIIQRIGLVYLKPRVATWRYKRGSRSLVANLANLQEDSPTEEVMDANNVSIESEEVSVPDSIEDVIEELLQGLRSSSSDVRWSAAKGLGRVTNRLPKSLGDEVVGSVIEIFNPLEPHEAWHGACLAIAELAKRGLLLPYRLSVMVPLLTQAMFYDEMKGYMSVGQHIRDASCYMCWAFARAYDPKDFQPFVMEIAAGLLTAAVFDREINCRRAASAAFQESVGRLGNFPHGIDISTTTDFYSVGLRTNSYLNISNYIAQFEEYTRPLIDHLIEKKVGHWDTSIRELSAKALHNLTKQDPNYMCVEVLPKLFAKTDSIDIATRHGSVFAIGEICLALRDVESSRSDKLLTNQILSELNELVGKFVKKDQFRGMSGEITKQCCTDLIKNCSKARIDVTSECLESWQQVIDKCIVNKNAQIREAATGALSELCKAYYNASERSAENAAIVEAYLKGSENDLDQHIRMGFVSAIGTLPKFMLTPKLNEVIHSLIKHSLPPHGVREAVINGDKNTRASYENTITCNWSEARRDSVKALTNIVQTVGFDGIETESIANPQYLNRITDCYLKALEEYTLDNRGDIGAWVREAAMCALFNLLINCPNHLLNADIIHQVMVGLAQQAVEKIDRTRGLAGKFFCNLVHATPSIPHIKRHDKLLTIFPQDSSTVLWLFADHTFPLFCVLLELPEYSERVLLGLSASIGQLTESLIKYSSSSLFQFLRSHTSEVPRICSEIVSVFQQNSMNERVTYPMLNFLDILLSSGTINRVLVDESSTFADDIFRLVNLEIKGHKKLYKLVSSINVFCQLIQVPRLCGKILSKMSVFLGLTHVHIRKTSATKLYEALALHGDNCGISEEILDEILTILSETDWGMPLVDVRPIRNKLCDLMGVKAPISAATAAPK